MPRCTGPTKTMKTTVARRYLTTLLTRRVLLSLSEQDQSILVTKGLV